MGKKRIHRKPVALTFADTSNQPSEQEAEGCSSWNPTEGQRNQRDDKRSTKRGQENGDGDDIECMGMVSSSTASSENNKKNNRPSNREVLRRKQEEEEQRIRQQEEDEFQRALELSRQEMQVTLVTNSTSDGIISNEESDGDDRVQTNNDVHVLPGRESDEGSSDLEDVGLVVHGEAQAQTSGRVAASRKNSGPGDDGSSDGEDSDVTDISDEEEAETGIEDGAGGREVDDADQEANGDDESSVGSSILLQSDEEEITAGQPPHASSSYPTQSSEKFVAKVGHLEDGEGEDGSIDIFDVMDDQDQDQEPLSQELFVDSQRTYQGYVPEPESTHSQGEDKGGSSNMDSRRTRLSLRKRKRDGEEGSKSRTDTNKRKAPRLDPISDSDGSEVDIEVQVSDDEENNSAPPSQDLGFMDFPQRFPDNAGVPLVDHRKPNHKSPFLTPPGVSPNSYTAAILRLFYQYKIRLLKAQAKQRHRIELGRPVAVGPHVKDTIVFKKRGQKQVFQWLLSSDEESSGASQENVVEEAHQARLVKPLRTEVGHLSKVFHNNNYSNKVGIVTGNQQVEARPGGFKPKVEWTRSISGSSGVQNNARTGGSVSLKSGDEVSSSRHLVIKVSPVRKNSAGEWISKSNMGVKKEAKNRLSSSDDSDADVEVVPVNKTTRTPLTATVSPRRSTPAESQSSNSLRSPVFGGKSSRGLVRPSSGVTRQVGHCSPRTVQNNRDKMESPQPSSPRLRVDNDVRTQTVVVAESASGVSSTVPDNGTRHSTLNVERHQEATASGSVSSAVPTSRKSADSPVDPARTCPTSTNHVEQGSNIDAAPAISKVITSSSLYGSAHSFEEERLLYYRGHIVKEARPDENGVGDVGSSSVNRFNEPNNVESDDEESGSLENISRHEQRETNGVVDNSRRDIVDRLAATNDGVEKEETRTGDDQYERHDNDEELQNINEAAVSVGTNSSIAEMDDHILDEGGGRGDDEEVAADIVEPVRGEEDNEDDDVLQEDGAEEPIVDGVQCPLCGVTFAMTVIEVHAAECNGPPENAEPIVPEPARRPEPVPGHGRPTSPRDRMVAKMEMLDRTSSEDEAENDREDDDDVMVAGVSETSKPVGRQNVRKRTFPSSETTSDSPTSSVGSMSHFDNAVMDMVRRNEIKVSAPGPSSSSSRQPDRTHPAPKRGKWQSKTTSSHAINSNDDEDDDDEPGEVEKCFICNKFILKSQYQAHVQNELDRMDASNNSQVESSSTPSRNTRRAVVNENGGDAVPSAVSTSTASTRRQNAAGGASRSGTGNAQGTRVKRVVERNRGEPASSTSHDNGDLSSDEESGPNSPSALDAYLLDSDDEDDDDEGNSDDDEFDGDDRVFRDPSTVPFSDSPIKAFKSLKHNPPCLIDFKNQFNTSAGGKTPKRSAGRGAGGKGSGRGRGRGKGKGKWKSGKKWGRGGKSRK